MKNSVVKMYQGPASVENQLRVPELNSRTEAGLKQEIENLLGYPTMLGVTLIEFGEYGSKNDHWYNAYVHWVSSIESNISSRGVLF